jgi:hypothetical protein
MWLSDNLGFDASKTGTVQDVMGPHSPTRRNATIAALKWPEVIWPGFPLPEHPTIASSPSHTLHRKWGCLRCRTRGRVRQKGCFLRQQRTFLRPGPRLSVTDATRMRRDGRPCFCLPDRWQNRPQSAPIAWPFPFALPAERFSVSCVALSTLIGQVEAHATVHRVQLEPYCCSPK